MAFFVFFKMNVLYLIGLYSNLHALNLFTFKDISIQSFAS